LFSEPYPSALLYEEKYAVVFALGIALMPEYTLPKHIKEIEWRYLATPEIGRKVYAKDKTYLSKKHPLNALIARRQDSR